MSPPKFTQWAAQFAVASELCKRNYEVALTLGNHPETDLMVMSPKGVHFHVDVKGLYKKNYFLVKPKRPKDRLYYVLALVPERMANEYFVFSQEDINKLVAEDIDRARKRQIGKGGTGDKAGVMPGISWKVAQAGKDRWDSLPD